MRRRFGHLANYYAAINTHLPKAGKLRWLYCLECCPVELSVLSSMGSHWPRVAAESLKCGGCDCGAEFFYLTGLNLNSHTGLEATVLGGTGLENFIHVGKKILNEKFKSLLSQSSGIIIINYDNRNS